MMNNPMNATIGQAERILGDLSDTANRLEAAIFADSQARKRAQTAEDALVVAVDEVLLEEVVAKAGPLALPTTSEAFKVAFRTRQARLREDQRFAVLAHTAKAMATEAEFTKSELDAAQVRFSAAKHASDLIGGILRASTL